MSVEKESIGDRYTNRTSICEKCENLNKGFGGSMTDTCKICGCLIHLKVLIESQHCPIDKW